MRTSPNVCLIRSANWRCDQNARVFSFTLSFQCVQYVGESADVHCIHVARKEPLCGVFYRPITAMIAFSTRTSSMISPFLSSTAICEYRLCTSIPMNIGLTLERRCVKQRFTYTGFPDCRSRRQSGCDAQDSASYALGSVNTTCSRARNSARSLASHTCFTLS